MYSLPHYLLEDKKEMDNNINKTRGASETALGVISQIIDDKGNLNDRLKSSVGGFGGLLGRQAEAMPITSDQRYAQPVIDQLKGTAFLQAFETLKGGGQITEVEGQKATQAIARINQAQDPKDFAAAISELKDIILTARQRAEGTYSKYTGNNGAQPTQPKYDEGDQDVDPQTGRVLATFTNGRWVPHE